MYVEVSSGRATVALAHPEIGEAGPRIDEARSFELSDEVALSGSSFERGGLKEAM